MSVQAGVWNLDGRPADLRFVKRVGESIAQWGPDGEGLWSDGPAALLYRPFHTTAESRREQQPLLSPRGFVLTWDGRLDNRAEFARLLNLPAHLPDADLIMKGFEAWGTDLFARILGDWALSIFSAHEQKLILARDIFAVRHLYYQHSSNRVFWSTSLNPIVQQPGSNWPLDYEYVAGYLAYLPEAHRTPYVGIAAVPPASWVEITPRKQTTHEYWQLAPKPIRYKTDAEYDEQFRHVFRQSVRRRLRSDSPILAELSGGMDSSAIVCMADEILAAKGADTPRVDTLSYYDDREPSGDEREYLRHVEEQRGRKGHHVDMAAFQNGGLEQEGYFAPIPGLRPGTVLASRARAELMHRQGNTVVLSGEAGDEFCGGWYDPTAHLADLIVQLRWGQLLRDLKSWGLARREPLSAILGKSLQLVLPKWIRKRFTVQKSWLDPGFARKYDVRGRTLLLEDPPSGMFPSERDRIRMYWIERQAIAMRSAPLIGCWEMRYPFLDRDFIEYMSAVPTDQLMQPHRRRVMMRRALKGLVPEPILERKRKAVVSRGPLLGLAGLAIENPLTPALGIADGNQVRTLFEAASAGNVSEIVGISILLCLEYWLRSVPLALPNACLREGAAMSPAI